MNISARFQLHPPYMASEEMIHKLREPREFRSLDKIDINLVEDYSRNISVKLLSKYLQ